MTPYRTYKKMRVEHLSIYKTTKGEVQKVGGSDYIALNVNTVFRHH